MNKRRLFMRHSDIRLTDSTYDDATLLDLKWGAGDWEHRPGQPFAVDMKVLGQWHLEDRSDERLRQLTAKPTCTVLMCGSKLETEGENRSRYFRLVG